MIVLLRHGRTTGNASGLLVGRADLPLDDEGQLQAAAAAQTLATTADITRVVSSPLERCRSTAKAVADKIDVPVTVDDRWIELDYGELDGTPLAAVPTETWAAWQADSRWRPPGGESLAELGERVRTACAELAADSTATGDVLVVTHVSPIKAALAWALGMGDEVAWRTFLRPASITRIATNGPRPILHSFNETSHLA
jgi:broad specificity phosphatase PhoE